VFRDAAPKYCRKEEEAVDQSLGCDLTKYAFGCSVTTSFRNNSV
jgi:hypothetical protein